MREGRESDKRREKAIRGERKGKREEKLRER